MYRINQAVWIIFVLKKKKKKVPTSVLTTWRLKKRTEQAYPKKIPKIVFFFLFFSFSYICYWSLLVYLFLLLVVKLFLLVSLTLVKWSSSYLTSIISICILPQALFIANQANACSPPVSVLLRLASSRGASFLVILCSFSPCLSRHQVFRCLLCWFYRNRILKLAY